MCAKKSLTFFLFGNLWKKKCRKKIVDIFLGEILDLEKVTDINGRGEGGIGFLFHATPHFFMPLRGLAEGFLGWHKDFNFLEGSIKTGDKKNVWLLKNCV